MEISGETMMNIANELHLDPFIKWYCNDETMEISGETIYFRIVIHQWEDHLHLHPPLETRGVSRERLRDGAQGGTRGLKALDNGHKIGQWSLGSTVQTNSDYPRNLALDELDELVMGEVLKWSKDLFMSLMLSFKISTGLMPWTMDDAMHLPPSWCSELYGRTDNRAWRAGVTVMIPPKLNVPVMSCDGKLLPLDGDFNKVSSCGTRCIKMSCN